MDLIMNKIGALKEAEGRPGARRRLTKEDIGNPVDFRHEVHIGWDSSDFNSLLGGQIPIPARGRANSEGPMGQVSNSPNEGGHEETSKRRARRWRRITKEDIGLPTHFRHKAHVGWDDFYGFRMESCGEPMDPSVGQILGRIGTAMDGGRKPELLPVPLPMLPPPSHRLSMPTCLPPADVAHFNPNCVQIFIDDRPVPPKPRQILKPLPAVPVEGGSQNARPLSDSSFFDSAKTRL